MSAYAVDYSVAGIEYKKIMGVSTNIQLSEIQNYKVKSFI